MKKQSFLYGAGILAVASLLCKIMSAMLKIPLDRFFLHEDGIAIYQSAYSIYNVFLAIFVTGIPIALSGLVAKSDDEKAASLAKSTSMFVSVFASVCAVILVAFSSPLAKLLSGGDDPLAQASICVLAVSFPAMGVISSRRGYFQGRSDMRPSALSQLAESFIKVALGIGLCAIFVKWGIASGAAGAIGAVSLGAIGAACVLEYFYRKTDKPVASASFSDAMEVIRLSVPMTLGAFAFTGIMLTDTITVPGLLAANGAVVTDRLKMFGYLTRANTVYNLPATIITAFTASAVPAVSAAIALKETDKIAENVKKAIKLIFLVSVPCMLGMILFAKEILMLLYGADSYWQLLALAGVMAFIMPYVQTTTAMLQTFGKVWTPIFVSLGGVAAKIVLNVFFVGKLGIAGAPLATITAFAVVFVINTVLLMSCVKVKGVGSVILKIMLSGVISCFAAKGIYLLHKSFTMLVVAVFAVAVLYAGSILLTGCIKKEEFISKKDV